jgi:hypothetical protein
MRLILSMVSSISEGIIEKDDLVVVSGGWGCVVFVHIAKKAMSKFVLMEDGLDLVIMGDIANQFLPLAIRVKWMYDERG